MLYSRFDGEHCCGFRGEGGAEEQQAAGVLGPAASPGDHSLKILIYSRE